MRQIAFLLAALSIAPVATAAEPCEFVSLRDWGICIGAQAAEALGLAEANADAVDDVAALADANAARLAGECPDGYAAIGNGACVDNTCRGTIGDVETDIDTHGGAQAACESRGARLCTMGEILSTVDGGCGFDNAFIAAKFVDGVRFAYKRPRALGTAGDCPGLGEYQGVWYPAAFDAVTSCGSAPIRTDADDHVDGFLCCL